MKYYFVLQLTKYHKNVVFTNYLPINHMKCRIYVKNIRFFNLLIQS